MKNFILCCSVLLLIYDTSSAQRVNVSLINEDLQPMPESAVFKMKGYYLWDSSVIEVSEKYHLFCSRWSEETNMEGWKKSHVIRAVSDLLFGPYTFVEEVLQTKDHPLAMKGIHNPNVIQLKDKFLLYHLGIPLWKTGFALSDNISGPWEIMDFPPVQTNNQAMTIEKDGNLYVGGKQKPKPHKDGKLDDYTHGFRALHYQTEFIPLNNNVGDSLNLLPHNYEMEDPTVWIANVLYNVICIDREAKANGINKAMHHYISKDGIEYQLVSYDQIWSRIEGIPYEKGKTTSVRRLERPQVFLNENREVLAMLAAALPESGVSFIVLRPVDKYFPNDFINSYDYQR